ncbi:hypothetical protein AB0383_19795 [Amycolatopsis sp. NPDC051373]
MAPVRAAIRLRLGATPSPRSGLLGFGFVGFGFVGFGFVGFGFVGFGFVG